MSPPSTTTEVAVLDNRVDTLEDSVKNIDNKLEKINDSVVELGVFVRENTKTAKENITHLAGKIEQHTGQLSSIQVAQASSKTKLKLLAAVILGSGSLGAGLVAVLSKLL
jgi:pyridoxine 5'-phosphate synthase PdxJ